MNKYLKNIALIMTIVAGVAAIIGLYMQYDKQVPSIEIKSITSDKLTDLPKVDGLNAQFFYKDSLVTSLWKLNYLIANNGAEVIVGEGNNKNIIKNGVKFTLPENYKILELVKKQDNFPFEYSFNANCFEIKFLQWRPDEAFELTLYVEQLDNTELPNLLTNEREILGGVVTYSSLQTDTKSKKSLFEFLPNTLQSILLWIGYVLFSIFLIVMPIVWISELVKVVKYKKWKRTDYWMYKEWIDKQIEENVIGLHYEPQKLPKQYWESYPYPKPSFPDNEFGNLTIGTIVVIILTLIPLLIMIKV